MTDRPPDGLIHSTREIETLIPHRWPFLLVDRIVEYDPDAKRIVGIKGVTATEWFFQGHFPGLPVMPGVLQVEALAQTMAVYVAKQPGFGDRIGLFAGIDETRFKRVVQPGDTLRLEVTMEKLGGVQHWVIEYKDLAGEQMHELGTVGLAGTQQDVAG